MKTHSMRVPPEVAQAVISHCLTYNLKVEWEKPDHDSHTTFTGKKSVIDQIYAYVCGWKDCKEAVILVLSESLIPGSGQTNSELAS